MLTRPRPTSLPEGEQPWIDRIAALTPSFAATVADDDRDARIPADHLAALAETGIETAFLPREHGGAALGYTTLGDVVRILAAAHPALATVWLMHLGAAHALVTMSTPEQAGFFAAELRAGKRFSNALSEPAGGNLFLSSQLDVPAIPGGWELTGRKVFVSGSEIADHLLISSRVDGMPAFFGLTVDAETVSFPPIEETMGMRATRSRTIAFERTPLLAERRCSPPPADYGNLISIGFAFISIGIAESALDALTASATKRKPGATAALADESWVKQEVGMAWAQLRAARLLAEQVAWLADERSPEALVAATESKMLANEVAKTCAALALRIGGGGAYLTTSPIQRIFRDAQAGALMAYSVPFSQQLVGGQVLGA